MSQYYVEAALRCLNERSAATLWSAVVQAHWPRLATGQACMEQLASIIPQHEWASCEWKDAVAALELMLPTPRE